MLWRWDSLARMEALGTLEDLSQAAYICVSCGRGICPEESYYAIGGESYCPECVEERRYYA